MWDQLKFLKHREIIKSILDDNNTIPFHVEIEPTETCNHGCIFCHWHGAPRKNSFPNLDFTGNRSLQIQRAIDLVSELKDIGTKAISFTGSGDPLMYKEMDQWLTKINELGIDFAVTSNFNMKLSDELINILNRARWIRVSIDAGSRKTYESIHRPKGKRSFKDTVENIKRLRRLEGSVKINVSYVICDENKDDIFNATKIIKELGVDSISFRPDTGFSRTSKKRAYGSEVASLLNKSKELEDENFSVYINYNRLDENMKPKEDIFCYYSNHSVYIAANGDIYPCCMTRYNKRYVIGNILNQTFSQFWNSNKRKNNYKKINMKLCPPCRHENDNKMLAILYNPNSNRDNIKDNFI